MRFSFVESALTTSNNGTIILMSFTVVLPSGQTFFLEGKKHFLWWFERSSQGGGYCLEVGQSFSTASTATCSLHSQEWTRWSFSAWRGASSQGQVLEVSHATPYLFYALSSKAYRVSSCGFELCQVSVSLCVCVSKFDSQKCSC